jgi:hypothetical protein
LKSDEAQKELVRDLVSKATNARFEIIQRSVDDSFPIKDVDWFIRCRSREDIERTPYLNSVWKVKDGPVWLESLAVGDTLDWIGSSYGEEAAGETLDLNYSEFSDKKFRAGFDSRYPLVQQRIQSCELIAEEAARKHRVHLELRGSGSKGIVVFTLAVRIPAEDSVSLTRQVGAGVAALRDAYQKAKQL